MPTGYTSQVADGKITKFEDFAMLCARNFGACITLRDTPESEIPKKFEPDQYYLNRLNEKKECLKSLENMTDEEKEEETQKYNEKSLQSYNDLIQEKENIFSRYNKMLQQVCSWIPPTPEHTNMKSFMIQQLQESINFDCSTKHITLPTPISHSEWYEMRVDDTKYRIQYHEKEYQKEVQRCKERSQWVKDLRESLKNTSKGN